MRMLLALAWKSAMTSIVEKMEKCKDGGAAVKEDLYRSWDEARKSLRSQTSMKMSCKTSRQTIPTIQADEPSMKLYVQIGHNKSAALPPRASAG